jgi:hypothetical protein
MKKYIALRSMLVYKQNGMLLPRGEKAGFGNVVFLISPTKEDGYSLMTDSFLQYSKGLYKYYMIDFIYKEKLGYKKYVLNNTGSYKKEFKEVNFPSQMTMVNNANKANILKQRRNLIVNLGEWMRLFLLNQIKSSNEKICTNFFQFLGKRMNDMIFDVESNRKMDYKKIMYINMDQWLTESNKLALDRKHLTNPISILLVTLYKFPEVLSAINGIDLILVSPSQNKVMRIDNKDLTKKNYNMIKQKIITMVRSIVIDHENMDETTAISQSRKCHLMKS